MRFKLFPLVVIVSVCAFSAAAQTVVESESSVVLNDKTAHISLVIESPKTANSQIELELLDPDGKVKSNVARNEELTEGKHLYEVSVPLGEKIDAKKDDVAWYRLRYKVGESAGIISMTQLVRDLFELRIIASDNVLSGMTYRVRVLAINPFSGLPAPGVKIETSVDLDLKSDKKKLHLAGTCETDADGFGTTDFTIPPDTQLDDDSEIRVVGRKNGVVREAEDDLRALTYDTQFLMMTDKPIYQPEQLVNIRGILLKGAEERTVLSNAEVEFRITDEDDTVLYREKAQTTEFGVASIGWKIPTNARLGDYRIEVRDASDDQIGGKRIKISRYDIPNFVVTAKPLKPYYLPGEDQAEVEVKGDYLFGKPVTKGKVHVVEETRREWNWKDQKYDIDEGQVREGETDADGKFTANFDLKEKHKDLKDDDWRKYEDIHLAAYFTDLSTNKTEQRRFDIRVTREPIHVYFIGDRFNGSLPVDAYVSTFYADGTPAECDVEIKASEEKKDKFKTFARTKTNSFGAGRINMARPNIGDPDDDLDFKVVAKDKNGRIGTWANDVSFNDDNGIQLTTDRAIYKPGDTITASIRSTIKEGLVYIDVVNGWSVIDSRFASLKNGRAEVRIPYKEAFKGELKIAAFYENPDKEDETVQASRGIIFPARQGIEVQADFDKTIYKPNEEATINFGVADSSGHRLETALGIVVLDKAVEERARTDADFGGDIWRDFSGWLGYGSSFGGVNVKDLNELDLSKPISADMQLVAEVILHDNYYNPNIFRSESYYREASSVFAEPIRKQFDSVDAALKDAYQRKSYFHAVNDAELRKILSSYNIELDQFRDPWGTQYKTSFSVAKTKDVISIESAGPDKQFGTPDDFIAFTTGFEYFTPIGKAIDTVVKNYHDRTGRFIRDEKTLLSELGMREILDRFGRPYKIVFDGEGRFLTIALQSAGPDGKFENYDWSGDDFSVWTNKIDYFADIDKKIGESQSSIKETPMNEAEFRATLKSAGINFDELRDGWGHPLYITIEQTSRYWDKVTLENVQNYGQAKTTERRIVTPVTQQIIEFTIRSNGRDGKQGTYDDLILTQVVHVLSEQRRDDPKPVPVIKPVAFRPDSTGSIAGKVTDAAGAAVANATVTATGASTGVSRSTTTSASGDFLIAGLNPENYSIKVQAMGFKDSVLTNIPVKADAATQANIVLEAGAVSETVEVSASPVETQTTSASIIENRQVLTLPLGRNLAQLVQLRPGAVKVITKSGTSDDDTLTEPNSTPRIREYFPETLLWQPNLVTDANGKAQLKFRMADNITTWKMYTIASTKNGKVGVAEKEITAFQPFFVDLDPPKFLTEGDEIYLPSQVRNYTDKAQKVDMRMDKSDWFASLTPDKQQINVAAGDSQNAVFGFKATTPVKDGKQRVTAIAQDDNDAIEKPVTVRPNGQEIVRTDSDLFTGEEKLNLTFPANALPKTQKAELKIYPNLYSHISESVEGLLERPYGCGEQTISSTYPNLMILKFVKSDSAIATKAKKYLQKGYERLLGYQAADGGFTYWGGKSASDIALTAYAIRFLNDAGTKIDVDASIIKRAQDWLIKQQRADGSWLSKHYWQTTEDPTTAKLTTTYVARSLAMLASSRVSSPTVREGATQTPTNPDQSAQALTKALAYLKTRNAEIDEPYALALYGLASLDAGDSETAASVAKSLESMAIAEGSSDYWKLETNTPFYGWGTAGRIETTALVTQLLIRTNQKAPNPQRQDLINKATLFLLKNKDRYGVWYSTQTTINVLDAFIAAIGTQNSSEPQKLDIFLNGEPFKTVDVAPDRIEAVTLDLTGKVNASNNNIEVRSSGNFPVMSQLVASHYIDWKDSDASSVSVNQSRALKLDYKCDKEQAAIMEEVNCSVKAERIGFQGYGMLLAEIGTPPGADVSRESLEKAIENDWSISHYEILPDRIVVYMWSKAGGTNFNFKFHPRYGINAQTPASVVYDYYNPEAQATVAPLRFSVR